MASYASWDVTDRLIEALNLTARWQAQLIITVALAALLFTVRFLILRVVHRQVDDSAVWYRTRKLTTYFVTIIFFAVLIPVWVEGSGFSTYLGFLTAGLAIALSDVLKNLAGWAYIIIRRPFRVGDRVEIAGQAGDVVDVRAFRFTVLEIANRVDADQSTGRLLHIPNGLVFTQSVANYTEGFPFLWHEIPVLVTFESNWRDAEELVLAAVQEHSPDMSDMTAAAALRNSAREYSIRYTHLTPTAYLTVRDSGVLITGRLLVPVRALRSTEAAIWRTILAAFEEHPGIELAYPTVRTYLHGPIEVAQP